MATILAVVDDDTARDALQEALERRFGADYTIVARPGGDDLAGVVNESTNDDDIAIALAPIKSAEFHALALVHDTHRLVRRIALVDVGDVSVAADLSRALTLNHVDYYVGQPWATAEEELYPVVGEALRAWSRDRRQEFVKATIVGVEGHGHGETLAATLQRNNVATRFVGASSAEGQALRAGVLDGHELPALILFDGRILDNPTRVEMVEALGARTRPSTDLYDVAIVGSGPAGLAAAVYAASEGLRSVILEGHAIGGQAATSAKIRNYLGFPWGVSGGDLAQMANRQAEQLGAEFVFSRQIVGLSASGDERLVVLDNGDVARARCVIAATGVSYRRLDVASVDALIGNGVFYGAAASEAGSTAGMRVFVLGGGNSAGQAAAHMAKAGAAEVTVLIRGSSPTKSMSDYLVAQLNGTPNVTIRCNTTIADAVGTNHLEGLVLADESTGTTEEVAADALFVFIGAKPNSDWLRDAVSVDPNGFVCTGIDGAGWLETTMPGVFAAGDIRAGSIKRVAAAVGEGSTAAMLAREYLGGD
jgi:thioredoxin reductase (NADPH)